MVEKWGAWIFCLKDDVDCASMVEEFELLILSIVRPHYFIPSQLIIITFVFSHRVNPVRETLLGFLYSVSNIL